MSHRDRRARLAVLFMLAGLAAITSSCSPGSGEGLDANGRPIGEGGGGGPLTATFGSIQANVFTPTCATAGCHVGAAAPQGLRLDAGSSFALLVGIGSNQVPGLLRVEPGNPNNSYLIQKLEGTAAVGSRMPLSGPPFLDQTTIDVIRQWITDGALPDPANTSPPQVVSIDPADGASLDQLPAQIEIIFSQDMDSSLFSDSTVVVNRSGGDGTFADGNEEVIQPGGITVDAANARVAAIDLSGVASVGDDYRILLVGTGATALASLSGDVLDGDADGVAGGDFSSTFTVTVVGPDTTPPEVTLNALASPVAGTVTVSVTATDNVGVTQVDFFVDGNPIGSDTESAFEVQWDTTTVANGDHELTASAMDAAGNTATSVPLTVTVQNGGLVFAVNSLTPSDGAVEVDFPAAVVAAFSANVNAATVDASTFLLERSGGDGTFGDGNEEQILGPVSAAGSQATLDLSAILPSFEDTYRATLTDAIQDVDGNVLDGDGDGAPGGDFLATFQMDLTTYTADVMPIFLNKCDTCHTGDGLGGHNIGTTYSDALLPADVSDCNNPDLLVGQCTIVRIQSGEMPLGAGCSGDPAQDAGNADCLTQAEQDAVQAWIDDGLPE